MQDSTEEIARRVLESVLRRLDEGAARQATAPSAAPTAANGSPIIVIMLGDQRANHPANNPAAGAATSQSAAPPMVVNQAANGYQNNSHAARENSLQSTHPGLQRFDLAGENVATDAPRTCFLEPDRACVGSGACKMRGF